MEWSDDQINILKESYNNCDKNYLISRIGRTWVAIGLKARQLGLKRDNGLRSLADLSVLLDDKSESYYWVGMLLADGSFHNNRIKLHLINSDSDHVDKFAKYIKYEKELNSSYIAVMNYDVVPKIMDKFGIKQRKTYNPPNLPEINDQLLSCLFVGFIDGDGCIKKQRNRDDNYIAIKCHGSWEGQLNYFAIRMANIVGVKPNLCRINNKGYADLIIANSEVIQYLKEIANSLPSLRRKWDKISLFKSKRVIFKNKRELIKKMYSDGHKQSQIVKELNVSAAMVCIVVKEVVNE